MKIVEALDLFAKKTGKKVSELNIKASFDPIDEEFLDSKYASIYKNMCTYRFNEEEYNGLLVSFYDDDVCFEFYATDITPKTKDVYKLMSLNIFFEYYGPEQLYKYPYLEISKDLCGEKRLNEFVEKVEFNPKKTKIKFACANNHSSNLFDFFRKSKSTNIKTDNKKIFKEVSLER